MDLVGEIAGGERLHADGQRTGRLDQLAACLFLGPALQHHALPSFERRLSSASAAMRPFSIAASRKTRPWPPWRRSRRHGRRRARPNWCRHRPADDGAGDLLHRLSDAHDRKHGCGDDDQQENGNGDVSFGESRMVGLFGHGDRLCCTVDIDLHQLIDQPEHGLHHVPHLVQDDDSLFVAVDPGERQHVLTPHLVGLNAVEDLLQQLGFTRRGDQRS